MSVNTVRIDEVLERLALDDRNRFNAYFVAYLSEQADIDRVNDYLLMKAQFGVLNVKIETICPNDHIDQHFEWGELPNNEVECRFCDDDDASYLPDPENTNIVYYFSSEYTEEIKKKRQENLQLLAI